MVASGGFPSLPSNPFDMSPLEADDRDLLIGRKHAFDQLHWELNEATGFSLVLLTGPTGSGRTSLMRVVAGSLRRSVHLVHVDTGPGEVAHLVHQIHQSFVGGETPSSVDEAMNLIKATLRRDTSPALVVLDLPITDGPRLPSLLSASMPYLERLRALFVVVTTPSHAARFGELQSKFSTEVTLPDLSTSAISDLIDARVRRHSQTGWRPKDSWIEENLGHVPKQPRDVVAHLRKSFDAHRRGSRPIGGATSTPTSAGEEAAGGTYLELNEAPALDFDISKLEDERERDAPHPLRPHERAVEPAGAWYADLGTDLDGDEDEDLHGIIVEEPSVPSSGPVDGAQLPTISPDIQAPSKPLPSSGKGQGFGRLSHRSSATLAGIAEARDAKAPDDLHRSTKEVREDEYVFTDLTGASEHLLLQDDRSFAVQVESPRPQPTGLSEAERRLLTELSRLIESGTATFDRTLVEQGLAGALMALGAPLPGVVQHRPLKSDALKRLNKGAAVVVEVASQRPVSPSDTPVLHRLGIKRARLSQICNALHRDGVLDVSVQGRQRVYTLSLAARGQLQSWGFPVGDAQ